MINRLFLAIAKRLRPELSMMSGLDLIGSLIDLAALLYLSPFAIAGLIWLAMVTEFDVVRQAWPVLALMLLISWVFRRLDFTLRLEIKPGVFSMASGSFETLIYWSAVLVFGPTALWLAVAVAIANFRWLQVKGSYLRWYRWRELFTDIATSTLTGLLALLVYRTLGGTLPFPGVLRPATLPVLSATLLWFLLPRLLMMPILLYASRSPEMVGADSLIDQASLARFFLVGISLSGVADPFAVLAAGLYAQQGSGTYFFFVGGALLATLLANRLSHSVARGEQRSRELAILERLARAILIAHADKETLANVLGDHVPGMFPNTRVEIRLFPDDTLFQNRPTLSVDSSVWNRLRKEGSVRYFFLDAPITAGSEIATFSGLALPIIGINEEDVIGGICLLSRHTGVSIADFLPAAQSLADQIASAMHRIKLQEEALAEQAEAYQKEVYAQAYQAELYAQALALEKMTQELTVAGQIQASFLPEELPELPGWQIAVALEPAREASGDFYDFIELSDNRLGIVIADVADKGMGAALYMALSRTLIRTFALQHDLAPQRALEAANKRILADTNSDLFVTVFYAVLDIESGELRYCNAGHNPPLLRRASDNRIQRLTRTALPLGILDDYPWEQSCVQLCSGDMLILYTDGVTESQDEDRFLFGVERLERLLMANVGHSADVIEDKVIAAVYDFAGDAPQYDDITLMVLIRES